MADLNSTLQALVANAQKASFYDLAEMQVQSDYVLKVLEALGWESRDWKLGQSQEVDTGKMPDIVLHDKNDYAVFVMDCKDASGPRKIDGYYGSGKARKSFVDKLFDYCEAEGIYWGMLTNFVEWRLYSVQQKRLYLGKKFAVHDLLWPKAERRGYVDLLSEEGLAFLSLFQRKELCERKGKVDTDPVYYPQEEEIKEQFFARLRAWRGLLRSELFQNYGERFDKQEIDLFTQKILDRVIFMDVCHDKGIIGPDHLRAILHSKGSKYGELKHRFRDMDERFNTELFMPHEIDRFEVSDSTLIPILNELILTDFSRISVHIIGEVYENYLGEILRVTKKKGLRVQEHKEQAKRKEHGIYYTPEYIVDYIVKNTLGELLKEVKTEAELRRIRVLDPACGSGSFLIRAFDLFYEAYHGIREKGQLAAFKDFEIKKAILQNNLFGVDLDERAVEIAKLNLMLKALEGVIWEELKGRKLLPNLNLNIRCGNSLISGHRLEEQYEGELALGDRFDREIGELVKLRKQFYKETEDEEKEALLKQVRRDEEVINRKLNANLKGFFKVPEEQKPLNFQVVFPEVFRDGGFDGVIGNPPYGATLSPVEADYFKSKFKTASYQIDTYPLFIENSYNLLKFNSLYGMIVPSAWVASHYNQSLRELLRFKTTLKSIVITPERSFEDATVETLILIFSKRHPGRASFIVERWDQPTKQEYKVPLDLISSYNSYVFPVYASPSVIKVVNRIRESKEKASSQMDAVWGVKVYQKGKGKPKQRGDEAITKCFHSDKKSKTSHMPLLGGSDIHRYWHEWSGSYIDYGEWLAEPRSPEWFSGKRILVREVTALGQIQATLVDGEFVFSNSVDCLKPFDHAKYSLWYILGILNSKLISFYHFNTSANAFKGAFPKILIKDLLNIPLPQIDLAKSADKWKYNKVISLVKEMLSLNRAEGSRSKGLAQISAVDKEIDQVVYSLYGLAKDEIEVVEKAK